MSFAAGNSSFSLSPFGHILSTSSSKCCLQPPFPSCSLIMPPARRKRATSLTYLQRDSDSCATRAALGMGFAVIRLLKLRQQLLRRESCSCQANDADSAETAETAPDLNQNIIMHDNVHVSPSKLPVKGRLLLNPFTSILNTLVILGSGVLAVLFALKKKEKATSDAAIEYMKNELKEKEAAITYLEKKFEEELTNEIEIQHKALEEVKAEQQSLVNRLEIETDTITSLSRELQKERKLVEELSVQVDNLEHSFQNTENEKRQVQQQHKEKLDSVRVLQERIDFLSLEIMDKEDNIWHLSSRLVEKKSELNQWSSVYQQSEDWLISLRSENKHLKDVSLKNEEELQLKNEMVHKLHSELTSSLAEKDESNQKVDAALQEYSSLKYSMEKKSASDEKLLREWEGKTCLLEENLRILLDDMKKGEVIISSLTQERDNLIETLEMELKTMKGLGDELRITKLTIEESRYETSELDKQLQESRRLCSDLQDEVSKVQSEFREARDLLQINIDEAKHGAEILVGEVNSAKNLFSKSNEEVQIMTRELAAALQKCSSLEEELTDALRKAESATSDMNEEKKIISSLNKELMDLQTQITEDKEARTSLESDLEKATDYLNKINQNALMLSRELELAHAQVSSLEEEKERLCNSLAVEKKGSHEARVNLEDAHNLVMRLGKERESLIKRGKKLEEELASAKGEILLLMGKISSSAAAVNTKVEGKAPGSSRRSGKQRRRGKPQQLDS